MWQARKASCPRARGKGLVAMVALGLGYVVCLCSRWLWEPDIRTRVLLKQALRSCFTKKHCFFTSLYKITKNKMQAWLLCSAAFASHRLFTSLHQPRTLRERVSPCQWCTASPKDTGERVRFFSVSMVLYSLQSTPSALALYLDSSVTKNVTGQPVPNKDSLW